MTTNTITAIFNGVSCKYDVIVNDDVVFSVWSDKQAEEVRARLVWTTTCHGLSISEALRDAIPSQYR